MNLFVMCAVRTANNCVGICTCSELDGGSTSSSQAHVMDGLAASQSAAHTAQDAGDVLALLQTRKKLKKLQDVRARLNQLRDLVQYYQRGAEFIHDEDASLPPPEQNLYAAAAAAAASNIRYACQHQNVHIKKCGNALMRIPDSHAYTRPV